MSTRAIEAIPRPSLAEYRGDNGNSITTGSVSSSGVGRVAGAEVHSLQTQRHASLNLSPVPRNSEQAPEKSQAMDDPKSKSSSSGVNDASTKKSNRSSASVASNALKNVGKKLKLTNNISGLQFNPGLVNLGNTCYLNSTLQGLMSTKLLENMVELTIPQEFVGRLFPERSPALRNGRGGQYALEYAHGMELCMTFIRTMEDGWKLRNTTNPRQRVSMTPRALRNRLGMKYDQYIDFQQQDAHEFLRHLLDCMYMEEFDIIKKRQPPPPKRSRKGGASAPQPQPIPEEDRLLSFVDQVFGGQLASMLVCSSCKHVSHTYEPFMDLSLSIRGEDKDTKRNRLKSFAQRFTRQSGRAVHRPLSNPPSPRKNSVQIEPPINVERRRSLEEVDDRPDSDPDENHLAPPEPAGTSETLGDGITRLGRRVSMQLGIRKSSDRSRSGSPQPAPEIDPNEQKKKKEQAYLGKIMADAGANKNPIELLRSGIGANSSPSGDSLTAAAASWLRLGPSHGPSLIQCMQQFTSVESLEGENKVGCSRCWKLANPSYVSRRKSRDSDSSSSSSDDSSSDEDEPVKPRQTSDLKSPEDSGRPTRSDSQSRQMSQGIYQENNPYRGPPIPSISTSSPPDPEPNLNADRLQVNHNTNPSSSTASSVFLTPASSRHGSIHRTSTSETGDVDTKSTTTSVSDESSSPKRVRQIREARIPKSQRVLMRAAYKRYLIAVPPPVLVIHLKRFQQISRTPVALFGSLKKIDDFIAFPEYLDMKPFIAPRKEDYGLRPTKFKNNKGAYDDQVMYRLYSVVVHIGNMLGGHYVAYTALPSPVTDSPVSESGKPGENQRRWSFQSDQIVRLATLEEVLSAKAYLCFYERVYESPETSAGGGAAPQGVQQRKK